MYFDMFDAPAKGETVPAWARPIDIHFDHGAAAEAIDAVAAARVSMVLAWGAEDQTAQAALGSWEGQAARAFERSHHALGGVVEDLDLALRMLQAAIEDAVDVATAEQARIDAAQAAWDAERRREILAAQEAETSGDQPTDPAPVGVGGGGPREVR